MSYTESNDKLMCTGDAGTSISRGEQTAGSDSTSRAGACDGWRSRWRMSGDLIKAKLGFRKRNYNAERMEPEVNIGSSSEPLNQTETNQELILNPNRMRKGDIDHDYVDNRREWVVKSTEGMASLVGVTKKYTVQCKAFNVSVTVGSTVGVVGLMSGVGAIACVPLAAGVATTWVVKAMRESSRKPEGVDVALTILNGDLELGDPIPAAPRVEGINEVGSVQTNAGSTGSGDPFESGVGSEVIAVRREKTFFKPRPKHRGKIPLAAGEVAALLKIKHVGLEDTRENRLLIRADAGRKAEALRREGFENWENMRNIDLLNVIMHASQMYWILTNDEEYVGELYDHRTMRSLRRRRNELFAAQTPR